MHLQLNTMETYNNKPTQYKLLTQIDSYCVEFESFPVPGLNKPIGFGA